MASKAIIVYHAVSKKEGKVKDCPDGSCAAWVVYCYLCKIGYVNEDIEVFPEVHHKNDEYTDYRIPFDYQGKAVYFVDFTYPLNLMAEIAKNAYILSVSDHHEDKINIIGDLSRLSDHVLGVYSPNVVDCGATLAWKMCFPHEQRPWFLKYVYAKDVGYRGYYEGEYEEAEIINEGIGVIKYGNSVENSWGKGLFPVYERLCEMSYEEVYELGKPAIQVRNRLIEKELELWHGQIGYTSMFTEDGFDTIPIIKIQNKECDRAYSVLGSKFHKTFEDKYPFVVVVTSTEPNVMHLRSRAWSKVNLSELAKKHGGGGHFHASGCTL